MFDHAVLLRGEEERGVGVGSDRLEGAWLMLVIACEGPLTEAGECRRHRRNPDVTEDFSTLHPLSAHSQLLAEIDLVVRIRFVAPREMRCQEAKDSLRWKMAGNDRLIVQIAEKIG
jgi:hypothetical protein